MQLGVNVGCTTHSAHRMLQITEIKIKPLQSQCSN